MSELTELQEKQGDIPAQVGSPFAGGFYAGLICVNNKTYALVVAPKTEGEHTDIKWIESVEDVSVGSRSFSDGEANTAAMADAGSHLANWALKLTIAGYSDWYLPALDELEIIYRNLKPTDNSNSLWARSGINLSVPIHTAPYSAELPMLTEAKVFQSGGTQAFESEWYWTSTRYTGSPGCAWIQDFTGGSQYYFHYSDEYRARVVRKVLIK